MRPIKTIVTSQVLLRESLVKQARRTGTNREYTMIVTKNGTLRYALGLIFGSLQLPAAPTDTNFESQQYGMNSTLMYGTVLGPPRANRRITIPHLPPTT